MADENVPAPALTRSDDQILSFAAWVPIGKSKYMFWIFKRSKRIQSFRSLWIFYKTQTSSGHSLPQPCFQMDETRFVLDANLLREDLEITPIDQAYQFVSPPLGDAIMDFVNELGYTEVIHFVSRMAVNNLYQPWRAILSMINQCLTSKTSGYNRPRYSVLQLLWGIITSINVDYAELTWEEFVQAIHTFLTDKANLDSPTKKGRKDKPHVIPYWTILGKIRLASLFHLAKEDHRLGNLKFIPKGEKDEVFGMPIPNELISNNIRNASYYNAYLEMVAKHNHKIAAEKEEKKKPATAKQLKPKPAKEKPSKLAPASKPKVTKEKPSKPSTAKPPKPKPVKEKSTKPTPLQKAGKGKVTKVCNVKSSFQLVDELDEEPTQPKLEPEPETKYQGAGDTEILQFHEEQGDEVANVVTLEENTDEIDEDQAGSDLGETPESRPPPDDDNMDEDQAGPDLGESSVALVGPNPKPTHEEFMANVYPNIHESLKFLADEHVILEDPLSSTGTLSSMKNLNDAFTIGDQFINDKATEDELEKINVESEVVSMVTVPIYQASSIVLPLFTPVIDLTSLKPQTSKNLDKTTKNLGSRVFTLELRDLPHKINEMVRETVKEAVQVALQALLRDRFKDLSEADIKEMLHQRMFESGSYKSLPEHVALYEALEASMESWKTFDTREAPSSSSKQKFAPHFEQPVDDMPIPDEVNISDLEDNDIAHLSKIKPRLEWLKHIPEEDRPETPEPEWLLRKTGDMGSFIKWFCKRLGKKDLSKSDLEGATFKVVKSFHENSILLQFQMEECHRLLMDQFDLVNLEGHRFVPDVSKMLPLGGPPGQIKSERDYNISAAYGITHWWFKRKEFYITRHNAPSDGHEVRSSVVSLKTFKRYGYAILKEIVIRRADYKEYKILEADFKNLHPNDFKDLNIVIRQRVGDLQLGIKSYQTKLNLTQPNWDALDFLFKEDYTIVNKPRAIIYRDINELDHMVKDFRLFEYNRGIESRIWLKDDTRRSEEFMEVHIRMEMEMETPWCSRVKFITACSYSSNTYVEIMKGQAKVLMLPQTLISTSSLASQSNEVMME
ncbi:hypothetical protein Tco_0266610 [Tanacetum coccineum]